MTLVPFMVLLIPLSVSVYVGEYSVAPTAYPRPDSSSERNPSQEEGSGSLEALRERALQIFLGKPGYDETSNLNLADHLWEEKIEAHCRAVRFVRRLALEEFSQGGFIETAPVPSRQDYTLDLVREAPRDQVSAPITDTRTRDSVLFYYWIQKSPGISCRYTLGLYARREQVEMEAGTRSTLAGEDHDTLFRELKDLIGKLESRLRDTEGNSQ